MNLGQWLKSLSAGDHIILIILYALCVYLSKVSLENLIEMYDKKKNSPIVDLQNEERKKSK